MKALSLTLNGRPVREMVEPREELADFLRGSQALTGTHVRCEQGACGACTVLVDGAPVRACITYAVQCEGAEVVTVEGLADDAVTAALREAFSIEHALQCGYCTPGMLVTARDIVIRLPNADEKRIREELAGNLCRCTGYRGIVRAIARVLAERRSLAIVEPQLPIGPAGAHAGHATPATAPATTAATPQAASETVADGELGLAGRTPNLSTATAITLALPVEEVWAAFSDVALIAEAVPGASLDEPPRDGRIKGRVAIRLGPIATDFAGRAVMERDDATQSGILRGTGRDRLTGSGARADVTYALTPNGADETRVDIRIDAILTGTLSQFGRGRIVEDLVARLSADVARRLEHRLTHGEADTRDAPASLGALALLRAVVADRLRALFSGFRRPPSPPDEKAR